MMHAQSTKRVAELAGQQQALLHQKRDLILAIERNSEVVNGQDEVYELLSELQAEFSEDKVGLYSELLTAIVQDVMGDRGPRIELKASMEAKKPALDIYALTDGRREDVVNEKGGSINNLISAGLRFIGLALSSNRRLAILDEADCWVQTDLVAPFIRVIEKLCEQLAVQAIYISHYSQVVEQMPLFKVRVSEADSGAVQVHTEYPDAPPAGEGDERFHTTMLDGVGVRSIRIENYMSHENSFIPLSPGLTVIVGDNDVGKSVVTRAVADVVSNNRSAARIRHDQDIAAVELAIEDGQTIRWAIHAQSKGLPKAMYTLLNANNDIVQIEENATHAPEWLHESLAMSPVNGLDLHVGHQKDPLFVLNPAISKHKRAQLIHLGDELGQINAMMRQHRDNVLQAGKEIKRLKQDAAKVNESLDIIKPVSQLDALLSEASELHAVAAGEWQDAEIIQSFIARNSSHSVDYKSMAALLDSTPTPKLYAECQLLKEYSAARRTKASDDTLVGLVALAKQTGVQPKVIQAEVSVLVEFLSVSDAKASEAALGVLLHYMNKESDSIAIAAQLSLLSSYSSEKKGRSSINEEIQLLNSEIEELESTIKAHGGYDVCPTCQQPITAESRHEIHHH